MNAASPSIFGDPRTATIPAPVQFGFANLASWLDETYADPAACTCCGASNHSTHAEAAEFASLFASRVTMKPVDARSPTRRKPTLFGD